MSTQQTDQPDASSVERLSDSVSRLLELLGVVLLGVIVVLTLLQVAVRELPVSVVWTEELARFALIVLTFVGMPYAMKQQEDISLRQIIQKLPFRYWRPLFVFSNLMVLVLCVALILSVSSIVPRTIDQQLVTVSLFAQGHAHLALGVGAFLTALYAAEQTVNLWRADDETALRDERTATTDETPEPRQ